nr:PREDICTED: UDP-glucuronosyltransferase 2B31-like [Bemisia tabaci]
MKLLITVVAISLSCGSHADNILVFLPTRFWSHYIQVEPIFHALANRGHNVTVVSPFSPKNQTDNFRHYFLLAEIFQQGNKDDLLREFLEQRRLNTPFLYELREINLGKTMGDIIIPQVLESQVFQDLVHGDNKFDLIFTEAFMWQEALVILGHLFKAPVVTYCSYGYAPAILRHTGLTNSVAYLPLRHFPYVGQMSFLQRMENALTIYAQMLYDEYWYYPQHDALLAKHIPGPLPRITDMLRNISLFFLTGNTALDGAKLYPPHVVELSGAHFKEPAPLDKELKHIMDTAEKGVVYFAFGSVVKASLLCNMTVQAFLTVFKELGQIILWKSDMNHTAFDIPKNVYIRDHFDQISILAHPNCVLFITHGGVSSMMEAIRYAIPIIGVPFFSDQDNNVANAQHFGYGLRLPYSNVTEESLRWAIQTVLRDPRFKKNISRASRIFTDKPVSSLDTAIYWIEYVIRHNGAHHLKPLAVYIPWYQLFLIDVIVIYYATFCMVLYILVKLFSFLSRKLFFTPKLLKEKIN